MDQMNISMTDHLASYVRKKLKSGRYNSASEVVRDVVRRMEEQEARARGAAAARGWSEGQGAQASGSIALRLGCMEIQSGLSGAVAPL